MSVTCENFGRTAAGRDISLYTITNENGVSAAFTDLGACWVSMIVPDKDGHMDDVTLGLKSGEEYELRAFDAIGAPVGRNANRIDGCRFSLNGVTYTLSDNDGGRNLHSGPDVYYKRLWKGNPVDTELGEGIEFSLFSPDMDQGMPGNLNVSITYILTPDNSVVIEYRGLSDKDTLFNMTHHAYFNLAGHNSGNMYDELLWIDADRFLYGSDGRVTDDEPYDVTGTAFDFRQLKRISDDIGCDDERIRSRGGYDHNFCLNTKGDCVELAAKLVNEKNGRFMDVFTDLPGIQIYTGNFLSDKSVAKDNAVYHPGDGIAMETQFWPDAINHPDFAQPVIKAGCEFMTQTIYHFGVIGE